MSDRDVLDISEKSISDELSTIDPNLWENLGLPIDYHPWFGWNVPEPRRFDGVGLGLALQCASVKARDIAKSGMTLQRRQPRNKYIEVEPKDHWFAKMLAGRPNDWHSWTELWRMVITHLELAQNSYILKETDRRGNVLALIPLQPARVRQRVGTDRRMYYEISAATEFERSQLGDDYLIVPAENMIHLRGRMLDGLSGMSNATLGNPIFELIGAINAFQTKLFGNDGTQTLVFETDREFGSGDLADQAFRRLKGQLREATNRARNGEAILLEAGLKAKSIALNSRDALTTDSYKQMVERICGLMDCPPHKIYHYGDGAKYDNQAQADVQYVSDCLKPIALNIEEKLRLELLSEDDWGVLYPWFDREEMTASDIKSLNERVKVAMGLGLMSINEGRERFDLNPIDGGDIFMIPVNMALMDEDGKIIQQAATGQTSGNEETEDDPQGGDDGNGTAARAIRLVSNKA